jgi:hypothetical protein
MRRSNLIYWLAISCEIHNSTLEWKHLAGLRRLLYGAYGGGYAQRWAPIVLGRRYKELRVTFGVFAREVSA